MLHSYTPDFALESRPSNFCVAVVIQIRLFRLTCGFKLNLD